MVERRLNRNLLLLLATFSPWRPVAPGKPSVPGKPGRPWRWLRRRMVIGSDWNLGSTGQVFFFF